MTGVAIDGTDIRLRNKQHQAIVTAIDAVAAGDLSQLDSLNGKLAAARAVEKKAAAKLSERLAQMTANTDRFRHHVKAQQRRDRHTAGGRKFRMKLRRTRRARA